MDGSTIIHADTLICLAVLAWALVYRPDRCKSPRKRKERER